MFKRIKKYCFNLFHPAIGEVWQLHRVTNEVSADVNQRDYEVTPQRLISLIKEYISKEYHFISVDQLYAMYQSNHWEKKFVCVTLDDGYADNYEIAYPIFKQYNIPFCVFVTKNYVLQGKQPYGFLSEQQIQELSIDPLCTIGSHTVSHPHLNTLPISEQKQEIEQCKEWLEQLISKPVRSLAYPYGAYSANTIEIVHNAGVSIAFAAWGGSVRKNTRGLNVKIPRILVTQNRQS